MTSVALVSEWLDFRAGSEFVFEELWRTFPSADLFAYSCRTHGTDWAWGDKPVRTTLAQRIGVLERRHPASVPLMPLLWRTAHRKQRYDVVLTSSHAFSKAFPGSGHATHFCYVHTPARYVWLPELDVRNSRNTGQRLAERALQRVDRRLASRVNFFAANSHAVRERIEMFYDRSAVVIHPPVRTSFYSHDPNGDVIAAELKLPEQFVLFASRLVRYKQPDLAIRTARRLGLPIVIVGAGPEEAELRARYPQCDVTFLGQVSDDVLRTVLTRATMLLYPGIEDFGIVPVEAQAAGTPIVARSAGGALDTVVPGTTGCLSETLNDESFFAAAEGAVRLAAKSTTSAACRMNAARFTEARFRSEIAAWTATGGPA
jgi:glycosyltransferase involved in cell wall biosynthesis